jgi:hypothetical protein
MNAPIDWLLEGEAWIQYRTRRDLLGQAEAEPQVMAARLAMLEDGRVQKLLAELAQWPWVVISSHKSAGQPFHKLTFAADLGLTVDDPRIEAITKHIMEHQSKEGPFQLPMNISENYGGTGQDQWAWALCDAPLILYALVKLGLGNDPAVMKAIENLLGLVRENGWPCAVSKELGKFRGPGRKEDPCPFANLAMLKLLAEIDELGDSPAAHAGAETLLSLWSESMTQHPYIFYMGTDFRKLKAPFVWYDLVHVLEVLSKFEWLRGDARLRDMLRVMVEKADGEGKFTIDSVWMAWKDWEFGQKKTPSRWLTLVSWRIANRFDR